MRIQRTVLSLICVAAILAAANTLQAAPETVIGDHNPAAVSAFTLDFLGADFGDGFGDLRSGHITTTSLGYRVDADAAAATLVRYQQDVDSITLPYGQSTGPITVSVVPGSSSSVLFTQDPIDPSVFYFETSELYEITYTEDLSAYGFPGNAVQFPGNSTGVINYSAGTVELAWEGSSAMLDPTNPGNLIFFDYTCAVNTSIVATTGGVDILPNACRNVINLAGNRPITVDILGTVDLDVTQIDPTNIELFRTDGLSTPVFAVQSSGSSTGGSNHTCGCTVVSSGDVFDTLTIELSRSDLIAAFALDQAIGNQPIEVQLIGRLDDGSTFTAGVDCLQVTPNGR